jgi:hypothetical protein
MMNLTNKTISEIADVIYTDWKNVNFAAKPYLEAMCSLNSINDNYGYDSGKMIVAYFLGNATSWRGEVAKEVKAHLKKLLK